MSDTLMPAEQGTRWLFGKPYHWHHTDTDVLTLVAGTVDDCEDC